MRIPWKVKSIYFSMLPHYEIVGAYTGKVIGCTCGKSGRKDVLEEEPGATFRRVSRRKCSVCGKSAQREEGQDERYSNS